MITNQEAFDKSLKHLRVQGVRAVDSRESCMYRIDGLKCAIGALIPDEKYDHDFEHMGASEPFIIKAFDGNFDKREFYRDLQESLHDSLDNDLFLIQLEQNAQNFAEQWNLNYA